MMASVIVLIGMFLSLLIVASCFNAQPLICSLISTFFCLFIYEWYNVHGDRLTLKRRACFDVSNVLETYQTRARTLGHLFKPDPPTPGVSSAAGPVETNPSRSTEFNSHRDSHYANMYEKAIKLAKEMEAIDFPMSDGLLDGSFSTDSELSSDNQSLNVSFEEKSKRSVNSSTPDDPDDVATAKSLEESEEDEPFTAQEMSHHHKSMRLAHASTSDDPDDVPTARSLELSEDDETLTTTRGTSDYSKTAAYDHARVAGAGTDNSKK